VKVTYQFEEGMEVAYNRRFMRSIGCYEKAVADLRGTIEEIPCPGYAKVRWANATEADGALLCNLIPVARMHLEPM